MSTGEIVGTIGDRTGGRGGGVIQNTVGTGGTGR